MPSRDLPSEQDDVETPFLDTPKKMFNSTCEMASHFSLSVAACLGGLACIGVATYSLVLKMGDFPLHAYGILFGFVIAVLEANRLSSFPGMKRAVKMQLVIEEWVHLFTTTWGRGMLYAFEGSLLLCNPTFISDTAAVYMFLIAMWALMLAIVTARKLDNIKQRLMGSGDANDLRYILSRFDAYDKNKNGTIEPSELQGLSIDLQNPLTTAEVEVAVNILDGDRDGAISKKEFVVWWKTRARKWG